ARALEAVLAQACVGARDRGCRKPEEQGGQSERFLQRHVHDPTIPALLARVIHPGRPCALRQSLKQQGVTARRLIRYWPPGSRSQPLTSASAEQGERSSKVGAN